MKRKISFPLESFSIFSQNPIDSRNRDIEAIFHIRFSHVLPYSFHLIARIFSHNRIVHQDVRETRDVRETWKMEAEVYRTHCHKKKRAFIGYYSGYSRASRIHTLWPSINNHVTIVRFDKDFHGRFSCRER